MSWLDEFQSGFDSIASVLAALAVVSALEFVLPLVPRNHWNRNHLRPNLALVVLTLSTNWVASSALTIVLATLSDREVGLLPALGLGLSGGMELVVVLIVLDLAFYLAHVAMHKLPAFWRFHVVHHSDPAVDATTTLRQHPGETVIRFAFTGAFACALGASPTAYLVYRSAVAMNGLLEHANLRVPRRVDEALAWVTTWPGFHKVHHARNPALADSNYGILLSCWDRLFGTAASVRLGDPVRYGIEGLDDPRTQSLTGLLALPFRGERDLVPAAKPISSATARRSA